MIYHTSPVEIKEIKANNGIFEDVLFFSSHVYKMAVGEVFVYEVDSDELSFADVCDLYDEEIGQEIADKIAYLSGQDIDLDLAYDLLGGYKSIWEVGGDFDFDGELMADVDWFIQAKQAKCAVKMGFDGALGEDEQGAVYMIPMFNRENLLKFIGKEG